MTSTDLSRARSTETRPDLGPLLVRLQVLQQGLNRVILGKPEVIEGLLIALLAEGHILLEDIPGIGKTTLAKAFARSLNCVFRRIQFTPDLLPSDVLGTSIYHPADQSFHFQEGPIFTQILMADEINRASPRTQASLLEAMGEGQVTVDGRRTPLGPPFLVIATQNPLEYQGTYPLPEAQLDRFMMRLELGYPSAEQEFELLFGQQQASPLDSLEPVVGPPELAQLQHAVKQIHMAPDVARYLLKLIAVTRQAADVQLGVSPRGSLALFRAACARALLRGRQFVLPEDIRALAVPVLAHRLILRPQLALQGQSKQSLMQEMLAKVPLPSP